MEGEGAYISDLKTIEENADYGYFIVMNSIELRKSIEENTSFTFSRSGGNGGQNVNKLNTKAHGKIHISGIKGLDERELSQVLKKLSGKINSENFLCIDVDDGYEGTGDVTDPEGLKKFFERMMLPFFPVYYNEFTNGPRYISFLNQKILKLYTQLSGKRFRLGYKNRYPNGQVAFEWTDDIYRVYRFDGKKLCDASFAEGKVKNGYALIKQSEDQDWTVYLSGDWKDGVLTREDTQYRYKKNIDL